jgi:DNA-binding MarR family transcriptional regulator
MSLRLQLLSATLAPMNKDQEGETRAHAWAVLLTAHARLVERIEAALAAASLPPLGWYDVLWALESAEDRQLRMHELAEHVVVSRSNLTRLADRLEEAGLIARASCAEDRRGAYCVITPAGRALRKRMWPIYQEAVARNFGAHVSDREATLIGDVLARVARAVREFPREPTEAQATPRRPRKAASPATKAR